MIQKSEKLKDMVKKGKDKPKSKSKSKGKKTSRKSEPKEQAGGKLSQLLAALLAAQAGGAPGAGVPGAPGMSPMGLPGEAPSPMAGGLGSLAGGLGMPSGAPAGAPPMPPMGGGALPPPPMMGPASPAGAPPPLPGMPPKPQLGFGGPYQGGGGPTTMAQCPKHAAMVHSAYGGQGGPSNIAAPAEPPCTCGADGDPMASTANRVAQAFTGEGGPAMPAPQQNMDTTGETTPMQQRSDGSPMEMQDGMGGAGDMVKSIASGVTAGLLSSFANLGGMFGGGAGKTGSKAGKGAAGMVKDRAKQRIGNTGFVNAQPNSNFNPQSGSNRRTGEAVNANPQGQSSRYQDKMLGDIQYDPGIAHGDATVNPQEQALGFGAIQPNQMGVRQGLVAPSFMRPNLPNQPQTKGFPLNTTSGLDEFVRNAAARNKIQNRTR